MKIILSQGFTTELKVTILKSDESPIEKTYNTLHELEDAEMFIREYVVENDEFEIVPRNSTQAIQSLLQTFTMED